MEQILLTASTVKTPMLDTINSINKNLFVFIFAGIIFAVIASALIINVLKIFADMRLSKDLYRSKIAQAQAQEYSSLVSAAADVKVAKEKEKDFPQTSLLNALMRNMKLDEKKVADCMEYIKSETKKSSDKATEEFLDSVVSNINSHIDNVSVEDFQALLNSTGDD